MDNRRQTYRHCFTPSEHHPVELISSSQTLRGEVVNISIEGLGVRLTSSASLPGRCRVRLPLDAEAPLTLDAEIVYRKDAAENHCGLHFLPLADLNAGAARERRLTRFVLEEQRRSRKRALP